MSVWDLNSRLQPSRLQLLMLGGLYLVALAGVWLAVLPLGVQIFASVVLAFSAWLAWRRWLRPPGQSVRELAWIGDQASLVLANGQRVRVQWVRSAVWRWLVVLKFRATDIEWSDELVLLPDSLPKEDFRRLKVRLLAGA